MEERQLVFISLKKDQLLRSPRLELSMQGMFLLVNSEDFMTEEIFQLLLSTVHRIKFIGKWKSNNLTTITTCPSSSRASGRSRTPTDS